MGNTLPFYRQCLEMELKLCQWRLGQSYTGGFSGSGASISYLRKLSDVECSAIEVTYDNSLNCRENGHDCPKDDHEPIDDLLSSCRRASLKVKHCWVDEAQGYT
jgi:hypothetical protein